MARERLGAGQLGTSRRTNRFSTLALVLSVGALLSGPSAAFAFRGGPPAGVNGSTASGGASCRVCHGNAGGPGSVQIIGFPAQYLPNALYDISVRVADPTKLGAGFQISFELGSGSHAGSMILTDAVHTQFNPGNAHWINHTVSGVNSAVAGWGGMGNAAVFNLRWQAPATDVGAVTAWAAGNAINNSFSSAGDIIYLTNVTAVFGGTVTGACCDDTTGQCSDDVTEAACPDRWGGANSTCATLSPACLPPTGACCNGNTGACVDDLPETSCVGDQRTWSMLASCDDLDPPCAEHTGACCDRLSGLCTGDVPGSACRGLQQTWTKGAVCDEVVCDADTGACCDHDAFGICTDAVTQAGCECPTCEWSKLESCENVECAHASIPTVSAWGLTILTLLLLIGSKVAFARPMARNAVSL